jgi:hypothetical protein
VKTGENEQRYIFMIELENNDTPAPSSHGKLTVSDWQVLTDIIDNPFLSFAEREQVLLQHGLMVIRV